MEPSEFKEFSLDVTTFLQSLKSWTTGLVSTIVTEAEILLNVKDAVQVMPSLTPDSRNKFLVAAKDCKKGMYECSVYIDHVTCTCPCYKFQTLCKHSICVAEISGILKQHLEYLKNHQDAPLRLKAISLSQRNRHRERKAGATRIHGVADKQPRPRITALLQKSTTTTSLFSWVFLMTCLVQKNVSNAASNFLEDKR